MHLIQLIGQPCWVDDHHIGAVANADSAGVHADKVRQLACQAVDGAAHVHKRRAGQFGVTHIFKETQREVVLSDGAQVRARVGEARLGPGAGQQLMHHRFALVAVAGGPLQRFAVLAGQFEVGVHRVQATGGAELLEILAN